MEAWATCLMAMVDNPYQLNIEKFLELASEAGSCIFDVRSESEYLQGHIHSAQSLPLLNNDHRHEVGLCYKNEGHQAAIDLGFQLVGPSFFDIIQKARHLSSNKKILLYCWRGGLRSSIMTWLLRTAGLEVYSLQGGYKAFRNNALKSFCAERNYLCLSGKTGTGKTELLEMLKEENQSILHLEALASHKGSAFGGIEMPPQPTQEQFENNIADVLWKIPNNHSVWFENESRMIGKVRIPDGLYDMLCKSVVVEIQMERALRIERILSEYGKFNSEILKEKTLALHKRMGPEQNKNAISLLEKGDSHGWAHLLLDYYDKAYTFFNEREGKRTKLELEYNGKNQKEVMEQLLIFASHQAYGRSND